MPVYKVTPDILSKHFIVDVEAGQEVHMRLCYKSITVCEEIISHKVSVLGSQIRNCAKHLFATPVGAMLCYTKFSLNVKVYVKKNSLQRFSVSDQL